MDSGLGQALIGGGLQGDLRQPIFSIGLKGVDPADAAKVRRARTCSLALLLQPAVPLGHLSGFTRTWLRRARPV